jgi:hypothetical protein
MFCLFVPGMNVPSPDSGWFWFKNFLQEIHGCGLECPWRYIAVEDRPRLQPRLQSKKKKKKKKKKQKRSRGERGLAT